MLLIKRRTILYILLLLIISFRVFSIDNYYQMGPFYTSFSSGIHREWIVHPLILSKKNSKYDIFYIFPVFSLRETKKYFYWDFLSSFIFYSNYYSTNTKDFGILPFFMYGSSKRWGSYLFIYPFGGTIKKKLAVDYIKAYGFPFIIVPFIYGVNIITISLVIIPVYAEYGYGDYKAYNILWPVALYGRSRERLELRFLPFFSYSFKRGSYKKWSIFLAANYQRNGIGKYDEYLVWFFFPFWGHKFSLNDNLDSHSLFYPFISWGVEEEAECKEYNFPWPLVQVHRCKYPVYIRKVFFPFYAYYKYGSKEIYMIGPLFFSLTKKRIRYTFNLKVFFPFYISAFKRDNRTRRVFWYYKKFWPFVRIEEKKGGFYSFSILALYPLYDPQYVEKLFSPYWSLFSYYRDSSGFKYMSFLFRILAFWGKGEFSEWEFFPFIKYGNTKEKKFYIFFLFDAFGYFSSPQESYIKVFWIKFYTYRNSSEKSVMDLKEADYPVNKAIFYDDNLKNGRVYFYSFRF